MGKKPRKPQPALIRIAHWVNVPTLAIMMMTGLQILRAYPYFGPQGGQWDSLPFQGKCDPDAGFFARIWSTCSPCDWGEWMRGGFDGDGSAGEFLGFLAGSRHLHFTFAWIFVINGLIYLAYQIKTGEFRRRFFWPPRDGKPAVHQILYYLRLRKTPPKTDLYNGLQRQAYTMVIVLGALEVLSGLVIYKPVQLQWLGWFMGGYDGARVVHLAALMMIMAFIVGHLIMVAAHWRQFPEMIHGGHAQVATDKAVAATPVVKVKAKPVEKVEAKPVEKAEAKPVEKVEATPVEKAEATPDEKAEAKPDEKVEAKPEEGKS